MSEQFFILMGVAGSGKSSVGREVAKRLGWALIEADDHHSLGNRQKMNAGIPLTDEDRSDWLLALLNELRCQLALGHSAVLLCSALKLRYRDVFRAGLGDARFVYLKVSADIALARVDARSASHDFPPSLVPSQFATLESPEAEMGVLTIEAAQPFEDVCHSILAWAQSTPRSAVASVSTRSMGKAVTEYLH